MKTVIHVYRFDTTKAEQKTEYTALRAKLTAMGLKCFKTWGGGEKHYRPSWDGLTVTLETASLFDNQWNTAPIAGISDIGFRIMDWAQDYPIDFPKNIKQGYWIEQTEEMREVRRNTVKCGYCGKQEPAAKGYVFCPHCLDSAHLTVETLKLTRLLAIDSTAERAELSEAERAYLLPLYREAQTKGSTDRGRARISKMRLDIESEYLKTVQHATAKRDGFSWLMDNGVAATLIENCIYYSHTGTFSFGWRKPLDEMLLSDVLEWISEFPFAYEIKCADGRKLGGL